MKRTYRAVMLVVAGLGIGLVRCVGDSPVTPTDGGSDAATNDVTTNDVNSADSPADAPADTACVGIDAASDPKNCGRCGHDCLGGTCAGGVCQPIVLTSANPSNASGNNATCNISTDGTSVCWSPWIPNATQAYVFCAPAATVSGTPVSVGSLANNGAPGVLPIVVRTGVVTVLHGEVATGATAIDQGNPTQANSLAEVTRWNPTNINADSYWPYGITANSDGSIIYFARIHQVFSPCCTSTAEVGECKGVACTVRDSLTDATGGNITPRDLEVDSTAIYWDRRGPGGAGQGEVRKVTFPPSVLTATLASTESYPALMSIDGTKIFWGDNNYDIRQTTTAGGVPPTTLGIVGGTTLPVGLVAVGGNVFTTTFDPDIYVRPEVGGDGGASKYVVGTGQDAPSCLTHDTVALYWIDRKDATLRKVALP